MTVARFLEDGRVLTGSADGVVRLWAEDEDVPVLELSGANSPIDVVVANAAGTRFAAASYVGAIDVWKPTPWPEVRRELATASNACLTPRQRREQLGENEGVATTRWRACEARLGR